METGVKLSKRQKMKLAKAVKDGSAVKIRLGKDQLVGNDELILTKTQVNRLEKEKRKKTGMEISISKSQIKKVVKKGGSLWSALLPLAMKGALPLAMGALGSLGVDKIFGKGMEGGAILPDSVVKMIQKGIEVPIKFMVNLINLDEMLTKEQRTLVGKGLMSGRGIVLKPTQSQIRGGFLGTLAAIGIPMAIQLASKIFEVVCKFHK